METESSTGPCPFYIGADADVLGTPAENWCRRARASSAMTESELPLHRIICYAKCMSEALAIGD